MSPQEIVDLEAAVGVSLPAEYRRALLEDSLAGDWTDHPEFITNARVLATENAHFKATPDDLSDVCTPGFLGAIRFWFKYGSGRRLCEYRVKLHKTWVLDKRFIIETIWVKNSTSSSWTSSRSPSIDMT